MMAHLPTCGLNRPAKKALVIGGGDGGVLRELGRHTSFEEIQIAEIDGAVIETSKAYFPEMAVGFDDPRVKVRTAVCFFVCFTHTYVPAVIPYTPQKISE